MAKKTKSPTARIARDARKTKRPAPDMVPNSRALAKALGVSVATIKGWKAIEGSPSSDASGRFRVSEWRSWVKQQGSKISEQPSGAVTKSDWEIEKLKRIVEKLDLDLRRERQELIPVETIRAWFVPALNVVRNELLVIPSKLAAKVSGMEPAEAEAIIRDAINEALHHIHTHPWEDEEESDRASGVEGTEAEDKAPAVGVG